MIDRLIAWSLSHRLLTACLALAGALAGTLALLRLPVDLIPDLSDPQVIVHTNWPGRPPADVERDVTSPLTAALRGLPGVRGVRAMSEFGTSMIDVVFEDGVDVQAQRTRIAERIAEAAPLLPTGVFPRVAPDATAVGQIFWYTVEGTGQDLGELRALQDTFVRPRLEAVAGVAEAASAGGMPRGWQIETTPERLRSYGVTLLEVHTALGRSHVLLGAGSIESSTAEHLVRGIADVVQAEDLESVVVTSHGSVPVTVGDVATVFLGPEARRCVLEKNGREVTGGVVLMRSGENPRTVTAAVERALRDLAPGLPAGVRVVPFYERTRLIDRALGAACRTLALESLVAALVVFVGMRHLGASVTVCLTIPLAILGTAAGMVILGITANLMSLAGVAVSVGVLVDQAIVLSDNSMHRLRERFGDAPVTGDVSAFLIAPCQEVGRPVFFGILIMVVSFLPVFALEGIEGRMFGPLAWTKTLVMTTAGVLTVTLAPALLPTLLRGRIRSEEDSWILRSVASAYRPVLGWLLGRPRIVGAAFAVLIAAATWAATGLGTNFLPPLDEGQILDMPVTSPRIGITQAAHDLKARNALLRSFPEVEIVVGKSGRAETATDPSPLEMIETVIGLRPHEQWPAREMTPGDEADGIARVQSALVELGALQADALSAGEIETVQQVVHDRVDRALRLLAETRYLEAAPSIGHGLCADLVGSLRERLELHDGLRRPLTPVEVAALADQVDREHGVHFAANPLRADVAGAARSVVSALQGQGLLQGGAAALSPASGWGDAVSQLVLGRAPDDIIEQSYQLLRARHGAAWTALARALRPELEATGARALAAAAMDEFLHGARARGVLRSEPAADTRTELLDAVTAHFTPALQPHSKDSLVAELDRVVRVPGWANIWTQPIVNRIDMLTSGIRTQVGVKVLGPNGETLERVAEQVAAALQGVRGAADVVAERIEGKSYVEVTADRERCAALGILPADAVGALDLALGGRVAAMIDAEDEQLPVRVRYARAARADIEQLGRIDVGVGVDLGGTAPGPGPAAASTSGAAATGSTGHAGAHGRAQVSPSASAAPRAPARAATDSGAVTVQLREIADLRLADGPAMIKSEDGLLCTYVQANVRGRDVVGFVADARREVEATVALPTGV